MTRKDFVLIAEAMKEARKTASFAAPEDGTAEELAKAGVALAVLELAHVLARTNPRFDKARFVRACGVEG